MTQPMVWIEPEERDGGTVYKLRYGYDGELLAVAGPDWPGYHAASAEEAMAAADAEIAGDWPRTGEWEQAEESRWNRARVAVWRAPVDPAGERRRAASWSSLRIYDEH